MKIFVHSQNWFCWIVELYSVLALTLFYLTIEADIFISIALSFMKFVSYFLFYILLCYIPRLFIHLQLLLTTLSTAFTFVWVSTSEKNTCWIFFSSTLKKEIYNDGTEVTQMFHTLLILKIVYRWHSCTHY